MAQERWRVAASGGFVQPLRALAQGDTYYQRAGPAMGLETSRTVLSKNKLSLAVAFGVFHDFLPRNPGYGNDCLLWSYSTFLSYQDSLMGRDMRFWELRLGPQARYRIGRAVSLGGSLWAGFTPAVLVEDYPKICDGERESKWIHLASASNRLVRRVNLGGEVFFSFDLGPQTSRRFYLDPGFSGRFFTRNEVYHLGQRSQLRTVSGYLRFGYCF